MPNFDPFQHANEPLEKLITFGKYEGATYRQLLNRAEEDQDALDYVRWLIDVCDLTPSDVRESLSEWYIEFTSYGPYT